jgi:hypothetical protein
VVPVRRWDVPPKRFGTRAIRTQKPDGRVSSSLFASKGLSFLRTAYFFLVLICVGAGLPCCKAVDLTIVRNHVVLYAVFYRLDRLFEYWIQMMSSTRAGNDGLLPFFASRNLAESFCVNNKV